MMIPVLAFGIAKEIFGSASIEVEAATALSVEELKNSLEKKHPKLKELASYRIAVNNEFADAGTILTADDEIAIIPPVSGG